MKLIDKIKKEEPYLAAYAWLHNAALREGSDREACRMTMAPMRIIHKIEALDTENGIWLWDYEEKAFKLEV